jgi:RNA polymerase sigma-70 factor (ECF subfamily)
MVFVLSDSKPLADDARISGDAALMRAAASGDDKAWAAIVSAHLTIVHRTAYQVVRDAQLAEDIAQESFLRLWKLAESWQPRGRISTWLCHVARNLSIDAIRRCSREQVQVLDDEIAADDPTPLEHLAAREKQGEVDRALQSLPARQRQAIMLVHFGECSGTAAADVMGVSVEALESLLSRARRTLRRLLRGVKG